MTKQEFIDKYLAGNTEAQEALTELLNDRLLEGMSTLRKVQNPTYNVRTQPDDFQFNIIQPNGANEL